MDWNTVIAIAGDVAANTGEEAAKPGSIFPWILAIMVIAWIFLLRPQTSKAQQQHDKMLNEIKKGDRVRSIGGIYGTVTAVDTTNNIISVQVDRNVKLDFDRNAISTVIKKEDARQKNNEKSAKNEATTEETAEPVEATPIEK